MALAFDENGLLWIRDGRDAVMTYSTVEGFVPRAEMPASIREKLFVQEKELPAPEAEPAANKAKNSPLWPWILVIALLLAVIAYLWFIYPRKRQSEPASSAVPGKQPLRSAKMNARETVAAQTETVFEDRDFEAKVRDLIEKNYTDTDFSVEQIASELGISRVHLSRKLKALNAASPSDMIKSRRMEAAAEMLRSGERNMPSVAAACGFSSAAYFSAAFKAFYGVSPSAFE